MAALKCLNCKHIVHENKKHICFFVCQVCNKKNQVSFDVAGCRKCGYVHKKEGNAQFIKYGNL